MKKNFIYLSVLIITSFSFAQEQIVNIPDPNFKNALLEHYYPKIDTNNDGEIQLSEAKNPSIYTLNIYSKNIEDLTGIEAFVNLRNLNCSDNKLTNLDISKNTFLTELGCSNNQLTNLDLSKNTHLIHIYCSYNELTSLDLSKNTHLRDISCGYNKLTSLDLSKNAFLQHFSCEQNQLTNLDISHNTFLQYLYCSENQLTSLNLNGNIFLTDLTCNNNLLADLDLGNNTFLQYLYCSENQLTSLDVSNNTFLKEFYCYENQLTSLDVSNNMFLEYIACEKNKLTSLNLKNGNKYGPFPYLENNPDLRCVQVDDVVYSNEKWSEYKDETACFSEDCLTPIFSELTEEVVRDSSLDLITTSNNSISGVWSPAVIDSSVLGTQVYTFTPDTCANTFTIEITVVEAANNSDFDLYEFSFYPNPTNDIVNFSSNLPIENITVNNILGQQIKVKTSSDKTSLDLSDLPAGSYLVKLTIEGVAKTFKIVKRH